MTTIPHALRNGNLTQFRFDATGPLLGDDWGAARIASAGPAGITNPGPAQVVPAINVWINEFHYDNPGGDTGEFIEIAGTAGTDLSEFSIVRYNGSTTPGAAPIYTSPAQTTVLTGTIANQGGTGFGTFAVFFATDGLQNGASDGFALVRTVSGVSTVIEFLSYEGVITGATGTVAAGMTSTDVGVIEPGTGAAGTSIGRVGSGSQASDFTWAVISDDNPGAVNNGQTFVSLGGGPGSLAIADAMITEGDSGTTPISFTVTRSGGSVGAVGATWTVTFAGGANVADAADFAGGQVFTGTVSFADTETSKTIILNVQGDLVIEPTEVFTVTLSAATGGVALGDPTAIGTITNNDAAGAISVADVSIAEGNAGTTAGAFTLTRTGGVSGAVSVDYVITLPGGAGGADGTDVSATLTGTVNFAEGQTSATVPFTVNGDVTNEPNETFSIALSNPLGGVTISDASGVATITNDDAPPAISIADAALVEGDSGVTYLVFTVTLSKASLGPVTMDFDMTGVTATDGSDYLGISGEVSFDPGETVQTIRVPVIGDTRPEANETLTVTLSNVAGDATLGDGVATGTITNDDGPAYYSLAGGSFSQNWNNQDQITVSDDWSGVPHIIGYRGDDLTTAVGADPRNIFTTSNVVDVNANQTNPETFITGGVAEFHVSALVTDATIALQGSGTADAPYLVLFMDATGRSNIVLQANLRDLDGSDDDAAQQINVQYRTDPNGLWINVPDGYTADATQADPGAGDLADLVTAITVHLPAEADGASRLQIRIMTTNAASNDEWVGIDDIVVSSQLGGPTLSIADAALFEGDVGTTPITFTVTRSGDSTGAVTADYIVSFGSGIFDANSGDFAPGEVFAGSVSFANGETTQTITLDIDADLVAEGDDIFTVTLSNPVGGSIIDGVARGTIVNDDGAPSLVTINDVVVEEGDSGTSLMTFTVTRTGGTDAFSVDYHTVDGSATAGQDYVSASGTLSFAEGETSRTISITINGDMNQELAESFQVVLSNATDGAFITDSIGLGTISADDIVYIHQIQGTAYFSPVLAGENITSFNTQSALTVIVQAVVTAVDNDGDRQGYFLSEEFTDWDGNSYTSEGIFVMTRDEDGNGDAVAGVAVGDLVTVTAHVMEYQYRTNMPVTVLTDSSFIVNSTGNSLPTLVLDAGHPIPSAIFTAVTPDYLDSSDGAGDTFDASLYGLSYWETVESMLVTIPDMVVADGFTGGSDAEPFMQAYSALHADADQINSRGGYTIAGDPPIGPPDTLGTEDDTVQGGRHLHDGDVNPDIIEIDFSGYATATAPAGLHDNATMGDHLGDVTGIVDFDFTNRKLFVTDIDPGDFENGVPDREVAVFGDDSRSLTVATFNVENLAFTDAQSRFDNIADAIANNLNAPDIISIEEIQDNDGAPGDTHVVDASQTWQKLVDALNLATGAHYQWVDQEPGYRTEGGEDFGNIRVGFLYNTDRVQLGDLDANATLAERRMYTDRIGDGTRDAGDLIAFSDDMLGTEITASDWSGTRRSLLGEFTFNGNTVYVTANHFPAKGGSGEFWQFDQDLENGDPDNSGWSQRNRVGEDIYSLMNLIQTGDPDAGIAAGGDFNDFYFYRPLTTVTGYTMADGTARVGGSRFENLTLTLSEAERYTYAFDGRNQAIDHIIVNDRLGGVASYDVVHINTGYNPAGSGVDADPALSDHDPALSSFDFRNFSEELTGTAGADVILGFGGNDIIDTDGGNDYLDGGAGADTLTGGTGDDVYIAESADTLVEASGEGFDQAYVAASYALAAGVAVEVLSAIDNASTAAIDLTGNEFGQQIIGNAGANTLIAGGGADGLYGLGGSDTYIVDSADMVFEANGGGFDQVYASGTFVLAAGSEVEVLSPTSWLSTAAINITGNEYAQQIFGNAGANVLNGGGGADALYGFGGDDTYIVDVDDLVSEGGGGGFDQVYSATGYALLAGVEVEVLSAADWAGTGAFDFVGNSFGQQIFGNAGANTIDGRGGTDVLYGFGGADTFAFITTPGSGNTDYIADFSAADDVIALDDAVFAGLALGALNPNAFVVAGSAQDIDDRIIYNNATGALLFDADGTGSGAAVWFATLQGTPTITASDFVVI